MMPFPALSLRWKLILASALVEVFMLTVLVGNSLRLMEESLTDQARTRLAEVSQLLNTSLGPLMAAQDYGPVADIFRDSRRRDGIQYFVLTDKRNRVILADGWSQDGILPASRQDIAGIDPAVERFDVQLPVTLAGQTYGFLNYGISTAFLAEARQHLVRQSLAIAAAEVLLSIALLAFLGIWLTRHLKKLEEASQAISAGHFDIALVPGSGDEVGRLAAAFNRMAGELKQRLEALASSEDRFRSLLSLSTDWYWEQDAQFRFTRHESGHPNAPFNAQSLLGRRRWELNTTLTPAQWASHRTTLEAHRTFRDLEYGVIGPDGRSRYFVVHGEPVFDRDGRFTGYRGTSAEITERKAAEESLRLAASFFAEAQEGIIITDSRWRIVNSNPTVTELTGYSREELVGSDLREHFPDSADFERMEVALWSLAEHGRWRGETQGRRRNGEVFPEQLTASAVRDGNGDISHYLFIFSDITAFKEQQQRLEHLAHYDALTRLPNRVLLGDRIQQALSMARRSGDMVAVAYLDLDGFKPVNDSLGHAAGDQALVEVATRLRNCLRGGDTVARLGGDEFVLLIRVDDFGECEAAILRVLDTLSAPYAIAGRTVDMSASIGITLYPQDGADPDVLLRHADQAMYVAKQAGRNRYHLFDSEQDRRVSAHQERVLRIRAALPAGEFELFYQPKVDMRQGLVIGAEALIRWRHPERGLVPPGEFLPLVEDSDFAIPLGEWVIATALAQMQAWRAAGLELPVSVNLSGRQLQAADFVERLQALLAAQPEVPPQWLELEILETAALDDIHYVSQVINRCQDLGLSFALDDFGTGYSSLTYFKRLPAQVLKIDQSFIRDMLADPEDLAIVDGVIGLSRSFRRTVIAEGVETVEHGLRLLEMGCELAQGFGIARPMPADQIPAWVRTYRPDPRWLS